MIRTKSSTKGYKNLPEVGGDCDRTKVLNKQKSSILLLKSTTRLKHKLEPEENKHMGMSKYYRIE